MLNFITRDPKFSDYRPAVDATGTLCVFDVLTALQQPSASGSGPRGIATIDISAFVS